MDQTDHKILAALISECRKLRESGSSRDEILQLLRDRTNSKITSIRILTSLFSLTLGEAKDAVDISPVWADRRDADDKFHRQLEAQLRSGSVNYLTNEVTRASKELKLELQPLDPLELRGIRNAVYAKYTLGDPTSEVRLHDLVEKYESLQDSDGWKLLGDLIGPHPAILFFDLDTDSGGFRVSDGDSLQRLIGDCFGFIFYVTSADASFLLCFDDHDIILASGTMAQRLEKLIGDREK